MNHSAKRMVSGIAGLAGSICLGSLAIFAARQRQLVFNPATKAEAGHSHRPLHRARRVVLRGEDGTRLEGWLLRPIAPGSCPLVLYFGGRSEDISWIVHDAASMFPGVAVLAVNYRGYGGSHGAPTERSTMQDGVMLHRWASGLFFVNPDNIAVMGRSLGSGIALQVAAQCQVAAVILVAPYDSAVAIAKRRYPALPVSLVLRHRVDAIRSGPRIACPALIIRAESDRVAPPAHTDRLASRFAVRPFEETIPGSDPMSIPTMPMTHCRIARFLQQHLPGLENRQ